MQPGHHRDVRIAIIGSGFSGLCLGIQLRKAGFHAFTILEKSDRLGGTWRDNSYPGAACDVPSFSYCFSFEQKTDWTRKWAPQSEILAYMEHCARKYEVLPHIRFGTEVAGATFDEAAGTWRVRTTGGETIEAEILVSGVGQLHKPYIPELPGLADFQGPWFHSARWNHDVALEGKTIGVIGNAASAVQFVPEIARRAARVVVFQRSANWMLPRRDRAYTDRERWVFRHVPGAARLYRWYIWGMLEARYPLFRGSPFLRRQVEKYAKAYIREATGDADLRRALVPDYPPGARRLLVSDDYYRALARDDVDLVTDPIDRISSDAVHTRDGRAHEVDVLVLATGFDTTHFLAPADLTGLAGRSLQAAWTNGARAYLGMTVPHFPSFFLMYGPNTNLGHNSILFMIECQARYIVACARELRESGAAYLDLRPEALEAYDQELQDELERTVWARTDHSWYKRADGRITNNWSGTTARYWWRTRKPDFTAYRRGPRRAPAADATR